MICFAAQGLLTARRGSWPSKKMTELAPMLQARKRTFHTLVAGKDAEQVQISNQLLRALLPLLTERVGS